VAGLLAAAATWVAVERVEDPVARRDRLAAEAVLPHLVLLFAAALRGGAPPSSALAVVCAALPGPAADRLEGVRARLYLGVDPVEVWDVLADDPVLAPLARTMARAARSGARVADAVDRLSVDLARQARARSEDRARTVGVRAAVPLGLCLLPAFLLIGIVPVVAGLMAQLTP
jgi:Flp pilus assembly protein TadB